MAQNVTLRFGKFTAAALAGEEGAEEHLATRVARAIRFYLSDPVSGSGRPDWPYPGFLRNGEGTGGEEVELKLSIDDEVWRSFEREADRQGVSTQQLAEHAALYLAADRDAGRATQLILDSLETEG